MGNNKYKLLIVEDEANIRSFIKANLETSDYQVLCAETCELGMMMYASHHPDLILLDLGLPDRDGMSLIQEVRETDTVPIIVLSARSNERDKVEALDLGANDYITKPFGLLELAARVRAALRRQPAEHRQHRLTGGDLVIDLDNHEVTQSGRHLDLTLKEYELLRILLSNSSRVVPRDELLGEIWGFDFVGETRTLDMHIKTLRAKLHDDVENPRYIKTIRSVGYKFIG